MTRHQRYYAERKNDEAFMEKRRAYQRQRRASNPEYLAYMRAYAKKYYKKHREALNKKRKQYVDTTRNERVSRFRKKEAEKLTKSYIIRLLTRHGKYSKEQITPALIRAQRKAVQAFREKKLLKQQGK
jgi:hypothetical protein